MTAALADIDRLRSLAEAAGPRWVEFSRNRRGDAAEAATRSLNAAPGALYAYRMRVEGGTCVLERTPKW